MKTVKMSLENMIGKMSRKEMSKIMAGSGGNNECSNDYCKSSSDCCPGAPKCVPIYNYSGNVCARY